MLVPQIEPYTWAINHTCIVVFFQKELMLPPQKELSLLAFS